MHLDTLSALEALRNALYKCKTYLLTYLLTNKCFAPLNTIKVNANNTNVCCIRDPNPVNFLGTPLPVLSDSDYRCTQILARAFSLLSRTVPGFRRNESDPSFTRQRLCSSPALSESDKVELYIGSRSLNGETQFRGVITEARRMRRLSPGSDLWFKKAIMTCNIIRK